MEAMPDFKILNDIKVNMKKIKLWYFVHFYDYMKIYISWTRYDSEM